MLFTAYIWLLNAYCEFLYQLEKFSKIAKRCYLRLMYLAVKYSGVNMTNCNEYYVFKRTCPITNDEIKFDDAVCETAYIQFNLCDSPATALYGLKALHDCEIAKKTHQTCECAIDRKLVVYNRHLKELGTCAF